jgi:phosphatidylserine/phosphatidylglycerophosphate/cardiolipin synthase-like enzyme
MKEAVAEATANDETRLNQQRENELLRRFDKLVKKADRLNPPEPKTRVAGDVTKNKLVQQPTHRRLINRLQRKQDEVLIITVYTIYLIPPKDLRGFNRLRRTVH